MKNCTECKHAKWDRCKNGNLHPSGDGKCNYPYKIPTLPQSMYWVIEQRPCGRHINRNKELKDHCVYWSR